MYHPANVLQDPGRVLLCHQLIDQDLWNLMRKQEHCLVNDMHKYIAVNDATYCTCYLYITSIVILFLYSAVLSILTAFTECSEVKIVIGICSNNRCYLNKQTTYIVKYGVRYEAT